MLFSIIVPVYNVEDYLSRCVESLINQTYKDIEIILVDDGSLDNSPSLCDAYAKIDSRIKVIHKKNGGLSDARNCGLECAQGEYILFVDSDDYIELNTCEKFSEFTTLNVDIIAGDALLTGLQTGLFEFSQVVEGKICSGVNFLRICLRENKAIMAVWLNVYKKEFLDKNNLRFKYGILHEDEQFTPRAFLAANTVFYNNYPFYNYVIRENSITTKNDLRKNAQDLYATCQELENIYGRLEDKQLKKLLLDSLEVKYLAIFYKGKLFRYGLEYIHKDFIKKNSFRLKTKVKAKLFCFSPKFYCGLNDWIKREKKSNESN